MGQIEQVVARLRAADGLGNHRDSDGTWLRLSRPPRGTAPGSHSNAGDRTMIDTIADRWGTNGGPGLPSTLWALLRWPNPRNRIPLRRTRVSSTDGVGPCGRAATHNGCDGQLL